MEGRKLTPRDLREGVAKGPKFKEMSSNCHEKGNEVCVTGKQNSAPAGGAHTFFFFIPLFAENTQE